MLDLKQNVQYVKGIGPKRVKVLNSIGIYTLYDLLTYFPRDYEDRTKTKKIIDLVNGEEAVIEATVKHYSCCCKKKYVYIKTYCRR